MKKQKLPDGRLWLDCGKTSILVSNPINSSRPEAEIVDDLSHPPRVVELDWTDADRSDRPEMWGTLVEEGRTIVAADVVSRTATEFWGLGEPDDPDIRP